VRGVLQVPRLDSREAAVALDMAGCPNRCRHCWLGNEPSTPVSEDALRWVVRQFRNYVRPDESAPFFDQLTVQTWYREPDFSSSYRRFWELECELSDAGKAIRFELASIWRLARDEEYAKWLKEIGTKAVQITFFGLEENTDYFTRRPGAFRDNIIATERLLEQGIYPRWQLFLTTSAISEPEKFVHLVHRLNLEERAVQAGGKFTLFLNTPTPNGEAFSIEHLRPSVDVLGRLPKYLLDKTIEHFGATDINAACGKSEAEWFEELIECEEPYADLPWKLAFMITPDLGVFSNLGEMTPGWKLGNLKRDGISKIIQRYERDSLSGLHGMFHVPVRELAQEYGRPDSRLLYTESDVVRRWLRLWEDHAG